MGNQNANQSNLPFCEELSLLLFNVGHGPAGNVAGITDDQVKGIEAVFNSGTVRNAQHLFVLASDRGQCGGSLFETLKRHLGIQNEYNCNGTVGIFQRRTENNFNTTFLGNNARAAFAKVTVPLNGGNVIVLLVSYHGKHTGMTIPQKKDALRQLISDSDVIKRCLGCKAVIIGGDFNLPSSEAKEATTDQQALPDVHVSSLDANLDSVIDYVVFWSDADVKLKVAEGFPKVLKWSGESFGKFPPTYPNVVLLPRPDPRNCPNVEPFDHPRLLYRFQVSRPN